MRHNNFIQEFMDIVSGVPANSPFIETSDVNHITNKLVAHVLTMLDPSYVISEE